MIDTNGSFTAQTMLTVSPLPREFVTRWPSWHVVTDSRIGGLTVSSWRQVATREHRKRPTSRPKVDVSIVTVFHLGEGNWEPGHGNAGLLLPDRRGQRCCASAPLGNRDGPAVDPRALSTRRAEDAVRFPTRCSLNPSPRVPVIMCVESHADPCSDWAAHRGCARLRRRPTLNTDRT